MHIIHPPLQYHIETKIFRVLHIFDISPLLLPLARIDMFLVSVVLLFHNLTSLESPNIKPFQIHFILLQNMHLRFICIFSWFSILLMLDISMVGCLTVWTFIYLLKGILVASSSLRITLL